MLSQTGGRTSTSSRGRRDENQVWSRRPCELRLVQKTNVKALMRALTHMVAY